MNCSYCLTLNLPHLFLLSQQLEREAFELEDMATNGKFLDPDQNPSAVLVEMKQVCRIDNTYIGVHYISSHLI